MAPADRAGAEQQGGNRRRSGYGSERSLGELADRMGIVVTEASPERLVATMPVEGNRQPFGLLHGGANAVLAETLGSVHAHLHAPAGKVPVGTDLNCTHHRAMTRGSVSGVSTPVHAGKSMACFEIVISDEAGTRVCTARLTCAFVDANRTPLTLEPVLTQATPR
jgi:1,4-dihydroxy-2-naphthoyl-CoA hydrolase